MKIILLLILGALQLCAGAKILAVVSMPSRSHHMVIEKLAIGLVKKGHEVTLVTPFKQSKPIQNLKEVIIPNLHQDLVNAMKGGDADDGNQKSGSMSAMRSMSKWFFILMPATMGPMFSNLILSTEEVQELIKKDEKYDIILGETFLMESILAGFASKSNASIIGVGFTHYALGNPEPSAYVPQIFAGLSNPRMTFCERLENTIFGFLFDAFYRLQAIPKHDAVMRKHFGENLPPLSETIKNTSLVLVQHHLTLSFPKPYLPNAVEIGGYHIDPPKQLPDDLQKYFDESKHGVIFFSLGSHIKSADLPEEAKQAILKAFARLKQDVLWKFEDETLKELPKNVKITKWAPQSDILAHPNLKLFITHGGLFSTTEAVQRGVPIIGIPVAGDQPINVKFAQDHGYGLLIELNEITEEALYNAVTEIVNNPKYKEKSKEVSALFNDRPVPPLETALYWIEYVIRHKGAPHLRSAAQDLAWYQLYLLDVLGFIFIVSSLAIYISYRVTKCIVKKLFGKKKSQVSKQKKRN